MLKDLAKKIANNPLISILDSLSKIAVLFAVIFWILEIDDRRIEREIRAWDLFYSSDIAGDGRKYIGFKNLISIGADLSKIQMIGVNLYHLVLEDLKITNSFIKESSANNTTIMKNIDFSGSVFENVIFDHASIESSVFSGVIVDSGSSFFQASMKNSDFTGGARLIGNFRKVDFSNSNFQNAFLSGGDFSEANFSDSDFRNTIFNGAILDDADFTDAKNLSCDQINQAASIELIIVDEDKEPCLGKL